MKGEEHSKFHGTADGTTSGVSSRQQSNGKIILNDRLQKHIGKELKTIYDAIVGEPIPQDLLDLLRDADGAGAEPEPSKK